MKEVFGNPPFDENGERILTTYDNAFSDAMMDIRVFRLKPGQTRLFSYPGEETAVLLLKGSAVFSAGAAKITGSRADVFTAGPYCLHACGSDPVSVKAIGDAEILVQRTKNENAFVPTVYTPDDVSTVRSGEGKFGGTARRNVVTVFDAESAPYSNMVLGEIIGERGNWSSYLPHSHPQPEVYYFLFDRPEGFGACFVGDNVYKSVSGSFAAIPGGLTHPQASAPGFLMYTCWMIRHLNGNRWQQTDRNEDPRYVWMNTAKF